MLRTVLLASSLVLIGAGLALAIGGLAFGWLIAVVGVADLLTLPLVLRATSAGGAKGGGEAAASAEPEPGDPLTTPTPARIRSSLYRRAR